MFDANKEAFCLHVRQLEEFFRKKNKGCAESLSAGRYTAPAEPEFSDGKKFTEKLNRHMAHLIYGRPSNNEEKIQGKDFERMFRWVDAELKKFKDAVADPALKVRDVDLSLLSAGPADEGKG